MVGGLVQTRAPPLMAQNSSLDVPVAPRTTTYFSGIDGLEVALSAYLRTRLNRVSRFPNLITGLALSMANVVEAVAALPRLAEVAVILHLPTDWIVTVPLVALTLQPPLAAYLIGLPSLALAEALNDGSPHRLS